MQHLELSTIIFARPTQGIQKILIKSKKTEHNYNAGRGRGLSMNKMPKPISACMRTSVTYNHDEIPFRPTLVTSQI